MLFWQEFGWERSNELREICRYLLKKAYDRWVEGISAGTPAGYSIQPKSDEKEIVEILKDDSPSERKKILEANLMLLVAFGLFQESKTNDGYLLTQKGLQLTSKWAEINGGHLEN